MRLPHLRTAAVAAVLPLVCSVALAHGGSYQGPPGEVPPDSREPSDPPPPPEGGAPGTPGGQDPGGPTTGGGDVDGPTTGGDGGGTPGGGPGGGAPPAGGPGGGVTSGGGGRRGTAAVGFEDWQYWWAHNRHELLPLRSMLVAARGPSSGLKAHGTGNVAGSGSAVRLATDAVIAADVVPLLRERLADADEHFDVRSAAALALAKIGDLNAVESLVALARGEGRPHKVVVESAALALGLLERDDAAVRETLVEIATDRSRGGSFARPFAAVALGFQPATGTRAAGVRDALVGILSGREPGEDVKPACLLALGLRGDASALPVLLRIVRTRRAADGAPELSDLEVGHAIQALGRVGAAGGPDVGDAAVIDALHALAARPKDVSTHEHRAAVIALGRVAPAASPKALERAVAVLVRIAEDSDDAQARHYALIALGRVGADARTPDLSRRECVDSLGRVLAKGRPQNLVRPYAAMGLALVGRGLAAAGRPVDDESIRRPIRSAFEESREPAVRSAYALASGLLRDHRAADPLLAVLEDGRANAKLRGFAALALGLLRDGRAAQVVRELATEATDRDLQVNAATAAGLLGDPRAVDDLVKVLSDPDRSQYVLGSAANALGTMGDERAVAPLCAIVRDAKRYPDLTRALAVVALGRLGDRREVPTLGRLGTGFDYRAYVAATRELLTIL